MQRLAGMGTEEAVLGGWLFATEEVLQTGVRATPVEPLELIGLKTLGTEVDQRVKLQEIVGNLGGRDARAAGKKQPGKGELTESIHEKSLITSAGTASAVASRSPGVQRSAAGCSRRRAVRCSAGPRPPPGPSWTNQKQAIGHYRDIRSSYARSQRLCELDLYQVKRPGLAEP